MKALETSLLALSSPLNLGLFGHARAPPHLESWKKSPLRLSSGLLVECPWEARGETGLNPAVLKRLYPVFLVPPEQHAEDGSFFIPPADVLVSEIKRLWLLQVVPAPFLLSSQVSCSAVNLLNAPTQPPSDVWEDFSFLFFCFFGGRIECRFAACKLGTRSVSTSHIALCSLKPSVRQRA